MKTAVLPNPTREDAGFHARRLLERLCGLKTKVLMQSRYRADFQGFNIEFFDDVGDMIRSCDVMIVLGGDGTFIHGARRAAAFGKPILGVNMGRLGFLSELEEDELDALGRLVSGDYRTEERMMLEIRYEENGEEKRCTALNDAVISRGAVEPILDFRVDFNGQTVCSYRGDGLIVSTPTGSTAYSLSAGGPIIDPNLACLLLAPVCSHSLLTRPVVFSPDARLTVMARQRNPGEAFLVLDGEITVRMDSSREVEFRRAEKSVQVIRLKNRNFYDIVNEKLGNGRNEV